MVPEMRNIKQNVCAVVNKVSAAGHKLPIKLCQNAIIKSLKDTV